MIARRDVGPTVRRRAPVAAVSVCCVVLVAACSSGEGVQREGDAVLMTSDSSEGMDALFGGTLGVTRSGCLGLSDGVAVVPVAWPTGTELTEDGSAIEFNGQTFALGAAISGSGGEISALAFDPPAECESDSYYQFWDVEAAG